MKTTAWKSHWQTLIAGAAIRRQEDRFYLTKKIKTSGRCSKIIIATGGVDSSNLSSIHPSKKGWGPTRFGPTTPNESFEQGSFSATNYTLGVSGRGDVAFRMMHVAQVLLPCFVAFDSAQLAIPTLA
jgi:hypothetical protein